MLGIDKKGLKYVLLYVCFAIPLIVPFYSTKFRYKLLALIWGTLGWILSLNLGKTIFKRKHPHTP